VNRRTVLVVTVSCLVLLAGGLVGYRLFRADVRDPVAAPRADKRDPLRPTAGGHVPTSEDVAARLSVAQTAGLLSTPWRLDHVAGRDLYLDYDIGSSSCDTDRGVYVKETARRVLVGHYVYDTGVGNPCTADMKVGHGVVHLATPLGKRSLWHVVVTSGW
jgi:hypothetical protein